VHPQYGTELASCHPSGVYNLVMASICFETLVTPQLALLLDNKKIENYSIFVKIFRKSHKNKTELVALPATFYPE
jgi:hypothetical protein